MDVRWALHRAGAVALYWVVVPLAVLGGGRALDAWAGWPRLGGGAVRVGVGACCAAAGAALIWRATRDFRVLGQGTPSPLSPPRRLVDAGAYGWCRHPMFLGYDLAALGVVLWVGSPGALAAGFPLLLAAQTAFLKGVEEPRLVERFGDAYRAYRRRVPFLVPGPRRRRSP